MIVSACASPGETGSVAGGTCKLPGLQTPEFVVRGKTRYDQRWADTTTEALVSGCGQPRPKARPPELDRPVAAKAAPTARKPATRKPGLWDKLRRKPADA